jgi:hypothetical protein
MGQPLLADPFRIDILTNVDEHADRGLPSLLPYYKKGAVPSSLILFGSTSSDQKDESGTAFFIGDNPYR